MPIVRGRGTVQVLNVDLDDDLRKKYGTRIPVVEHRGRSLCEYRLDRAAIEAVLQTERPASAS